MQNTIITGTGCYVPTIVQKNDQFLKHRFLNEDGTPFEASNEEIIQKISKYNRY